jgi:uncharacterized protein (DUF488 family)
MAVRREAPKRGPSEPARGWKQSEIYAIGHSTRPLSELVELLSAHGVKTLADVRLLPGSRKLPHFDREQLEVSLPRAGIAYRHLPLLGGRRRARKDSPNGAWRNAGFRGYADYMDTVDFRRGLEELRRISRAGRACVMCAEGAPFRCHRSLIGDALFARGVILRHISSRASVRPHRPTPFARVDGTRITYPATLSSGAAGTLRRRGRDRAHPFPRAPSPPSRPGR